MSNPDWEREARQLPAKYGPAYVTEHLERAMQEVDALRARLKEAEVRERQLREALIVTKDQLEAATQIRWKLVAEIEELTKTDWKASYWKEKTDHEATERAWQDLRTYITKQEIEINVLRARLQEEQDAEGHDALAVVRIEEENSQLRAALKEAEERERQLREALTLAKQNVEKILAENDRRPEAPLLNLWAINGNYIHDSLGKEES